MVGERGERRCVREGREEAKEREGTLGGSAFPSTKP